VTSDQHSIQRLLIIANGDCDRSTLLRCQQESPDKIICVDGGLRHCLEASLLPDVLLGDFDSAAEPLLASVDPERTQLVDFPTEKDATDLELALQYANIEFAIPGDVNTAAVNAESAVSVSTASSTTRLEVMLAGLSGGRTDHMLANWMLLANPEWRFCISVFDSRGVAYLVTPVNSRKVGVLPGATFSLLPLTSTRGVTIEGAKYPLSNDTLYPHRSRGISNIADSDTLVVSVTEGSLLLYVNFDVEC